MLPLVAVSEAECVDALKIAGFSLVSRTGRGAMLVKGYRHVIVPPGEMLGADQLALVLRDAGISQADFLELLSETPTEPAISRTRVSVPPFPR